MYETETKIPKNSISFLGIDYYDFTATRNFIMPSLEEITMIDGFFEGMNSSDAAPLNESNVTFFEEPDNRKTFDNIIVYSVPHSDHVIQYLADYNKLLHFCTPETFVQFWDANSDGIGYVPSPIMAGFFRKHHHFITDQCERIA